MFKSIYQGERSLFKQTDLEVSSSYFHDGESPLKEGRNITVLDSTFSYKYPLWYGKNINVYNSYFILDAHACFWYGSDYYFGNVYIGANKNFRRLENVNVKDSILLNSTESFWHCKNVNIKNSVLEGDYLFLDSEEIVLENCLIKGNYPFDSAKNIILINCFLNSKDAFWNCKNVMAISSSIFGEYIGWNSSCLRLLDCKIKSHQGFCYIDNLVIDDSDIYGGDLMFEYCSNIFAKVTSRISSVKNPISGYIESKGIDELIQDDESIDTKQVKYEQI